MHIFTAIKVNFSTLLGGILLALAIGYGVGYFLRKMFTEYQIKEAEARRQKNYRRSGKRGGQSHEICRN